MLMPIKAFPGGSIYSRLCMKLSSFLFAHAGNAAYIIFIMWDSISGLDTWYDFWFNISCGVVVKVRSNQKREKYPKRTMSSPACALSIYSCLCMKMLFFLFVCAWAMWNSISGLNPWYHFRFNISCGVAVTVRSHQKRISGNFLRGGEGGNFVLEVVLIF